MSGQVGSSRFDNVLKFLLIACISLLAFSTGVYFGREMTDSDYQLKALESNVDESQGHAAEKNKDYDVQEEDAIAAEDVEALTDKYVNAEKSALAEVAVPSNTQAVTDKAPTEQKAPSSKSASEARNVASANDMKPIVKAPTAHKDADAEIAAEVAKATKANTPDLSKVHEAARRVASNATPSEAPKAGTESRVPSSLPKSIGSVTASAYTVQVASYPNLNEAKTHASELVKKGFPAYPVEANVKGKTWYRVSVGSFKSMNEAGKYRSQLMKQANVTSAIVQKIER